MPLAHADQDRVDLDREAVGMRDGHPMSTYTKAVRSIGPCVDHAQPQAPRRQYVECRAVAGRTAVHQVHRVPGVAGVTAEQIRSGHTRHIANSATGRFQLGEDHFGCAARQSIEPVVQNNDRFGVVGPRIGGVVDDQR